MDSLQLSEALTVSNGLIRAYIVKVFGEPSWIVPESVVAEIHTTKLGETSAAYNGKTIPVYDVRPPNAMQGVDLIVLGVEEEQYFVVRAATPPDKAEFRISNIRDYQEQETQYPMCYQLVLLNGVLMQVPDLDRIQAKLLG